MSIIVNVENHQNSPLSSGVTVQVMMSSLRSVAPPHLCSSSSSLCMRSAAAGCRSRPSVRLPLQDHRPGQQRGGSQVVQGWPRPLPL